MNSLSKFFQNAAHRFGLHVTRTGFGRNPWADIRELLPPGDKKHRALQKFHAIDVGANRGQSISMIKSIWKDSDIYAFEPSPATFSDLTKRFNATAGVNLFNLALGSERGKMLLHENSSSDMSSFREIGETGWGSISKSTEVDVRTLDDFLADKGVEHVNLLKIDTQGFDFEVLKGSQKSLQSNKIDVIKFELLMSDLYDETPHWMEPIRFLEDMNYSVVAFYDFYFRNSPIPIQADAVMVSQSKFGRRTRNSAKRD
jgi:FkbM family methyltransferase